MPFFSQRPVRPSLNDPRFALLLGAESVNAIGGWASAIVLWGFAAYRFDASPYAVSVTIVCWAAPPAVLSPLMGVLVDRLGPRTALAVGYLAAAAAALGLAAAGSLAVLDLAAAGYGVTRSLTGPAGRALPPRIVAADNLLAANSLLSTASSAGQVAGPLAASAVLALAGFRAAFVLDAITYLAGAAAVLSLRSRPAPEPDGGRDGGRPGWRGDAVAGVRLVARNRGLRRVALISVAVTFTSGAFLVVEPLYARHVLGRPPAQFALFEAAAGAGAILAGLALPRLRGRLSGRAALPASAIGYGLAAGVFTGTTVVPVAYLSAFAWGVSGAVFFAVAGTRIQRLAPVAVHGRIMGVISTLESAADTTALPLAGVILAGAGVRAGAAVLAGVAVAAGAAGLVLSGGNQAPACRGTPGWRRRSRR
jgi:Na+/melibiose symporter-like transporter